MNQRNDRFKNFRNYLRKLMARCQITAYRLALMADLSPGTITRILKGDRVPSRDKVFKLAQTLYGYTTLISERDAQRIVDHSGYPPPRRPLFGEPVKPD